MILKNIVPRIVIAIAAYLSAVWIMDELGVRGLLPRLFPSPYSYELFAGIFILAVIVWNICVFFIYRMDKKRAARGEWRIREKTLLLFAVFFGASGAWDAMYLLRHKTQHWNFKIVVTLALYVQLVLVCFLLFSHW